MIVKKLLRYLPFSIILLFYQQGSGAITENPHHCSKAIKSHLGTQRDDDSATLPNLPPPLFFQHIANELDWVPSDQPTAICGGYYMQPTIVTLYPQPGPIQQQPALITAKGPSTITARGLSILRQNVVVTEPGRITQADEAYIYRDSKTGHITKITLIGHVRLREAGKLLVADKASLTLYPKTATLVNAAYHIYSEKPYNKTMKGAFNAWGTAAHAYRDENQVITLNEATYTTCSPTDPSWILRAKRIVLDKIHHIGKAYSARVKFKDIPIIYAPYYSFALDHQRKTGFLSPRIGFMTRTGGDFAFPFYWNMAPNYDLTITPEYLTQRNYQFTGLFRFLSNRSVGETYITYLPNDSAFQVFRNTALTTFSNPSLYDQTFFAPYLNELRSENNTRAFFSMNDTTQFNTEWSAHINLNYVTDPYFFADLGGQMGGDTRSNQLLNRLDIEYSGWHWDFMSMLQAYQTLHIINQTQNPALDQYTRLPDLILNGYYPFINHDIDFILKSEFVSFTYQSSFTPDKPIGQRLHLRPGLSFPIYFAAGYFTPQIWGDMTGYNVEHLQPGQTSSADRILPIADIDTSFYFDRSFYLGKGEYIQTLEPRIFYLYVPFQNQNSLPNFDTVLLPFYFEQLFSLNAFTGDDRIQNANQVSLGLTSRILDADNGSPILTANIGEIYYIDLPRVCLSAGCTQSAFQFSPIVGELTYGSSPWSISGNLAWDPNLEETNNAGVNLTYNREGTHIVSFGYLFVHGNGTSIVPEFFSQPGNIYSNNTSHFTTSAAWPIVRKWSGVGYWDYNINYHRTDAYFVGVQYDTCCWALRLITQHSFVGYVISPNQGVQNSYDTSYYFQLQLKGLGDFGTANLNKLLSSSIPGFGN